MKSDEGFNEDDMEYIKKVNCVVLRLKHYNKI